MAGDRFSVSALSRSRKAEAMPEEILLHKKTGQILVYTTDGNVISYDSMARERMHINDVTVLADNYNIKGDIFELTIDGIEFPEIVAESTNLMTDTVLLKSSALKKVLISVDLDAFETSGQSTILTVNEPTIKLDFKFTKTGQTDKTFSVTKSLSQSNSFVINPNDFTSGTDVSTYAAYLTGVTVTKNANAGTATIKNLIHSILIVME